MTAKQRAARAKFKAVVAEAKKLRKKNPKLTQAQAVKQAWAISYSKKNNKVGAVKKKTATKKRSATKVKAKKGKKTSEMHTDTKSHNVNIRVISGINKIGNASLDHLNKLIKQRQQLTDTINTLNERKKNVVGKELKRHYAKWINLYKKEDNKLRTQIAFAKKYIK